MGVCVQFNAEQELAGVRWDQPSEAGAPLPDLAADRVELLPNGGVRATDDSGRLWVGDSAAADDEGWIVLQPAD